MGGRGESIYSGLSVKQRANIITRAGDEPLQSFYSRREGPSTYTFKTPLRNYAKNALMQR